MYDLNSIFSRSLQSEIFPLKKIKPSGGKQEITETMNE